MISYTKKINQLNIEKIIENNFHTDDCQVFWKNNKTKETIFAFGCIDKIEMDKKTDINFIKQEIDEKLNNITDSKGHTNSYPKFFGGFSFNNDIKNNNWVSFPRGCFILPKCIIESNKHETTMTLIKKNQKEISPQTIEKELMGIYEKLKKNKAQGNIVNEKLILNQKKIIYLSLIILKK